MTRAHYISQPRHSVRKVFPQQTRAPSPESAGRTNWALLGAVGLCVEFWLVVATVIVYLV